MKVSESIRFPLSLTQVQHDSMDLQVEPWGERYSIVQGHPFVLWFNGPAKDASIEIAIGSEQMELWGWPGGSVEMGEGHLRGSLSGEPSKMLEVRFDVSNQTTTALSVKDMGGAIGVVEGGGRLSWAIELVRAPLTLGLGHGQLEIGNVSTGGRTT